MALTVQIQLLPPAFFEATVLSPPIPQKNIQHHRTADTAHLYSADP